MDSALHHHGSTGDIMDRGRFRFLEVIIDTFESKSLWTANHSRRVEWFARAIGDLMGLDRERLAVLVLAARLHDIGKIGVSDTLLDKRSELTDEEFRVVKQHPVIGSDLMNAFLLDMLDFGVDIGDAQSFMEVMGVIRHHHERHDGLGYPDGVQGDQISLLARIVHVADSLDSMITARPYSDPLALEHALRNLMNGRGTQFDPAVIDAIQSHFNAGLVDTLNSVLTEMYPAWSASEPGEGTPA